MLLKRIIIEKEIEADNIGQFDTGLGPFGHHEQGNGDLCNFIANCAETMIIISCIFVHIFAKLGQFQSSPVN